jgi:hypothetical protein
VQQVKLSKAPPRFEKVHRTRWHHPGQLPCNQLDLYFAFDLCEFCSTDAADFLNVFNC